MKKLFIIVAAAMLISTSAFAAGKMEKVTNKTTVEKSVLANIGKNNEIKAGTIKNSGQMKDVTNKTTLDKSVIVNIGQGNKAHVGTIEN